MAPRLALQTDFYELTMAAGYFAAGKTNDVTNRGNRDRAAGSAHPMKPRESASRWD